MIDIARRAVALGRETRKTFAFPGNWDGEWFDEQRAFCEDKAQLVAGICGRRAGKSRGKNRDFVRKAATTPNGRFVYLNETRAEAEKIAWTGARGDGMLSLCERNGVPHKANHSKLTLFFPESDAYIYLIGADDEAGVRKALEDPAIRKRIEDTGSIVLGNTPEQFGAFMKKELARYETVVKASGAKVD